KSRSATSTACSTATSTCSSRRTSCRSRAARSARRRQTTTLTSDKAPRTGRSAMLVAAGIFGSRVAGLVRSRVAAHYFGLGAVADAASVAFRIPNLLQNLFGDQALSASFIPVYASLLAKHDAKEADRVAGAVASL